VLWGDKICSGEVNLLWGVTLGKQILLWELICSGEVILLWGGKFVLMRQ